MAMTDVNVSLDDLLFAEPERLRHEIKFLRERVTNLEVFKKLFFTLQEDLVAERNKTAELDRQMTARASETTHDPVPKQAGTGENTVAIDQPSSTTQSAVQHSGDVAKQALVKVGECNILLDFFKESATAASYQDLVMLLFAALANWGLDAAVQIRCVHGELMFAQADDEKDHYTALINRFRVRGRLVDYEGMVFVNFPGISLLAWNFPKDSEQVQRIRDYLVTLCYGVNSRVDAIDANSKLKKERQNMYKIVLTSSVAWAS